MNRSLTGILVLFAAGALILFGVYLKYRIETVYCRAHEEQEWDHGQGEEYPAIEGISYGEVEAQGFPQASHVLFPGVSVLLDPAEDEAADRSAYLLYGFSSRCPRCWHRAREWMREKRLQWLPPEVLHAR